MPARSQSFPRLALCALLGLMAPPAFPEVVHWLHVPAGVDLDPEPTVLVVACGELGRYDLTAWPEDPPPGLARAMARTESEECSKCTSGTEIPPAYPPPFGEPAPGPPAAPASKMTVLRRPAADSAVPCAEGSCLAHPRADRTWIAVVDWAGPHGWSIAATIRTLAPQDLDVWLEPLRPTGSAELDPFSPRGVTDVHVLAALCRIEELAAHGLAPLAVNLSFGRWAKETQEPSLAAEIERTIDHLAVARGIPVLAAAGNYRQVQFPAAAPRALPVGALDLQAARRGTVAGTWETPALAPSRSRALLPVSGLCLPAAGQMSWPAPPGSSYATAILTGLLAAPLAADPELAAQVQEPQLWWLKGDCSVDHCETALQSEHSSLPAAEPAAAELLGPLFAASPPLCGRGAGEKFTVAVAGLPHAIDPDLMSRAEAAPRLKLPSPDSNPCVPCLGAGGPERLRAGSPHDGEPLFVDLSASEPLPAGVEIQAVELRLGTRVQPLALSPSKLTALARGELPRLALYGVSWDEIVQQKGQSSLRFIIAENALSYWVSIPLRIVEHEE